MEYTLLHELAEFDEFIENPLLGIEGEPHPLSVAHVKPAEPHENQILVKCHSLKEKIEVGAKFDAIFSMENIENFISISATLKNIYRNPSYKSEALYELEDVLCIIEFDDGLPSIIDRIRPLEGSFYSDDYETLYLSNQILVNKIIELVS